MYPSRRTFLQTGAVAAAVGCARSLRANPLRWGYSARAVDLVYESQAVDMLGLITSDWEKFNRWRTDPATFSDADFAAMQASGVRVFHPAVHLPSKQPWASKRRWLRGWRDLAEHHPDRLRIVRAKRDLDLTTDPDRIRLLLGSQNATHFERLEDVQYFAGLGQRVCQLTYNGRNALGSGCYVRQDRGLTAYGLDVVERMNQVGMLVDLSHAGLRTALDATEASRVPVVISHTNSRTLTPSEPRCVPDDLVRKIAATGGVIGVTAIRKFVGNGTLDRMFDHFQHLTRIAGPEAVGVGSDADLEGRQPVLRALANERLMFEIATGLLRRGFGDDEILLILGGNFRRVLETTLPEFPDFSSEIA